MVFRELLALLQVFASHSRKPTHTAPTMDSQPIVTETQPPTIYDLLAQPQTLGELRDATGLDYNTLKTRLNRLKLEGLVRDSFDPVDDGRGGQLIVLRYHRTD